MLKLMIAELQLLHRAGELADLRFQLIDADCEFRFGWAAALNLTLAAEQPLEQPAGARLILRMRSNNSSSSIYRSAECRHSNGANQHVSHDEPSPRRRRINIPAGTRPKCDFRHSNETGAPMGRRPTDPVTSIKTLRRAP